MITAWKYSTILTEIPLIVSIGVRLQISNKQHSSPHQRVEDFIHSKLKGVSKGSVCPIGTFSKQRKKHLKLYSLSIRSEDQIVQKKKQSYIAGFVEELKGWQDGFFSTAAQVSLNSCFSSGSTFQLSTKAVIRN